jgi:hypothetical protein
MQTARWPALAWISVGQVVSRAEWIEELGKQMKRAAPSLTDKYRLVAVAPQQHLLLYRFKSV